MQCKTLECLLCPLTRGHAYKLYQLRCVNSMRNNCFTARNVSVGNSLPQTVHFSVARFKRFISNTIFTSASSINLILFCPLRFYHVPFCVLCSQTELVFRRIYFKIYYVLTINIQFL